MAAELQAIKTTHISLGQAPEQLYMNVPRSTWGIAHGELTELKVAAIKQAALSIRDNLFLPGEPLELRPTSHAGVEPYLSKKPLLRRLGIHLFTTEIETFAGREQSDGFVHTYRGTTLGELLLYGAVADGQIVVSSDFAYGKTRLTSSAAHAADYADKKSEDRLIAERILRGLQLDQLFGLTVDQVLHSILMSPVVIRFADQTIRRHQLDNYKAKQGSGLPYFAVFPPMQIGESTQGFNEHTLTWSGIDIRGFLELVANGKR